MARRGRVKEPFVLEAETKGGSTSALRAFARHDTSLFGYTINGTAIGRGIAEELPHSSKRGLSDLMTRSAPIPSTLSVAEATKARKEGTDHVDYRL
jgi:hypothetical protein